MPFLFQFWFCCIISIIYFSFVYFAVLSFCCFITIARFNYFKLAYVYYLFSIFSGVMSLYTYFGRYFYIELDFCLTLFRKMLPCSKSNLCTYFTVRFILFYVSLLTLNNSMSFYCFRYYFIDIFMVNLLNSNFIVFFGALLGSFYLQDFTLKMASSKWKPNI